MKATFVHLSGSKRGETEVFQREWIQIGSHPESDLNLQGRPVALRHAEIRFENCEYHLRDLGSADGTLVNGWQIAEMAEVLTKVLGKPVEYVNLPIDQWRSILVDKGGIPEFLATHLAHVAQDHQDGLFSAQTDIVERIGGRPPQSLEDFV